jgi:hypothetical protein
VLNELGLQLLTRLRVQWQLEDAQAKLAVREAELAAVKAKYEPAKPDA